MATDTLNLYDQFIEDLAYGVHNLTPSTGDTLAVCFSDTAPTTSSDAVLADAAAIATTNLTVPTITINAGSFQTSGVFKLWLNQEVLTAQGLAAQFQYVIIYNDSQATPLKPLIGWVDYGAGLVMNNGESLDLDFNISTGVFQIDATP